ncbi:hypothetical protein EV144_105383 [Flavobacterium sp. 270]|uniref:YncE family protein n=1 Tax=Flavobacterium sp. 270 TaxID=2512114 RepID=UPI001065D0A2|nr:hypothetical protein [Flavobacterium sp. 270]TDW47360.1 hypothetical protein EV144_105383 [Flavobacterium sp. 270]
MKLTKLLLVAISVSFFVSCSNDDDNDPKGVYDNGFFVLNEGSKAKGTVSFSSDDLSTFTKDAYGTANNNDLPGGYLQNIFFDGDNAYIISGGSNVIDVVNRYTFKLIAKVETGLVNPRYGVVKDGKAYVTNANTFESSTDDYVAIIDLKTNAFESKIDLNATANRIVQQNGKLYITEPFSNSKLLIVDIATKKLDTPIDIGPSADGIEEANGILYILRAPGNDRSEIIKLRLSDKLISKIAFPAALDGAGFLDIYNDKAYYTVGNSVYSVATSATAASTTPILTSTLPGYVYGFAVNNNRIYLADGGDFGTDSKVFLYNLSGTLEKELAVGLGPNGFYFND